MKKVNNDLDTCNAIKQVVEKKVALIDEESNIQYQVCITTTTQRFMLKLEYYLLLIADYY